MKVSTHETRVRSVQRLIVTFLCFVIPLALYWIAGFEFERSIGMAITSMIAMFSGIAVWIYLGWIYLGWIVREG